MGNQRCVAPILSWLSSSGFALLLQATYQYDPYYSSLIYSQPVVRKLLRGHCPSLSTGHAALPLMGVAVKCCADKAVLHAPFRPGQAPGLRRRLRTGRRRRGWRCQQRSRRRSPST